MELRHIKCFIAVADRKGFREASRFLHVAQGAISRTVTNLEEEIGVKLFDRSGKTLNLSPEGEVFYAGAKKILEQSAHAVTAVQQFARARAHSINIGFCSMSTVAFLPDIIKKFKAKFPEVDLNLLDFTAKEQEAALAEGKIDVGFMRAMSPEKTTEFNVRSLYKQSLLAVVPKSRELKGDMLDLQDLVDERFIFLPRVAGSHLHDGIAQLFSHYGFSPTVNSKPENLHVLLAMVAAEQGVSILPACVLTSRADGVRFVPLMDDHVQVETVMAWQRQTASPSLRSFLELIEEYRDFIAFKTSAGEMIRAYQTH